MRKLLIINASPRKNGINSQFVKAIIDILPDDFEVKQYDAYKMNIEPCIGCGYCDKHKICAFRDMDEFRTDFEECDAFVIASPVYFSSFPSPMKALIDRLQVYYAMRFTHNIKPPIKKYRPSLLIFTAGSDNKAEMDSVLAQSKQFLSILNTKVCEIICKTNTDTNEITAADITAVKNAVTNLFNEINNPVS